MNSLNRRGPHTVLLVSKALSSQGGVVSVVSMLMKNFSPSTLFSHFRIGPNDPKTMARFKFFYPIYDCLRLINTVLNNHFDRVCLNTSLNPKALIRDGIFLTCLSFIRYKNTIVYIHGWDTRLAAMIKNNRILLLLFRHVFFRSHRILVLASHFRKTLIELGAPETKVFVVTTMFEGKLFEEIEVIRDSSASITLLFLSRFQREKGAYETIEAFNLICRAYPEMQLLMAGDGPETDALMRLVKEHDIEERVCFTGFVRNSDKAKVIKSADIFIFPTYYQEGCPVSLLEAMAGGLAIITSTVGAIPDIVIGDENGLLLKEINPEAIAGAIELLINDPDLIYRMQKINHQKAFEKYGAKTVTQAFEDIIFNCNA